jgi:heptosyltransferase-2
VRKTFPGARITFIVKKEFASLLKFNPHIDELIEFDSAKKLKGLLELNQKLRHESFDFVFDLHNNLRTNRLTQNLKGKIARIKKDKIKRAILVYFKINLYNGIKTIPERYLDVGSVANIKDDEEGLELYLEETSKNITGQFGLTAGKYICFAPGAAHVTKTWPLENVSQLIKKITEQLQYKAAILGSLNEKEKFRSLPENENVVHLAGKLSLLESAAIIKSSAGIITNDSGLMHMAAALRKPIVAIFGSTVRELGFFPFRADSVIIENQNLWCRPCSHIGRSKCPLKHFKCMREISADRVFSVAKRKFVNR